MRKETIKQFSRIHWQRTKKRHQTNRDIITMVIDPVTAFYLIPFVIIGGLIIRDALMAYQPLLQTVSDTIFNRDTLIFGLVMGQFGLFKKTPILPYSSSERLMEYVSHRRRDMFILLWLKRVAFYLGLDIFIAIVLLLVFPLYTEQIAGLILVVMITQIGLIIPRVYLSTMIGWRGFLERLLIQLAVLSTIVSLAVSTGEQRLGILVFLILILFIAQVLGFTYIEEVNDLDYIMSVSDYMSYRTVLSKVFFSKTAVKDVPIKRHEWYEKKRYQKRLTKQTMWKLYARLIWQHLSENMTTIFQMVIQLVVIVVLLSLQGPMFLRVGIVLAVLLFSRMYHVIFQAIFDRPLLKTLPLRQGPWSRYYGLFSTFSLIVWVLGLIGYSHLFYPEAFTTLESFTFLLITVILNREGLNRVIKKFSTKRPKENIVFRLCLIYMFGYGVTFVTYAPVVYGLASVITGLTIVELISKRFRSEKHDTR